MIRSRFKRDKIIEAFEKVFQIIPKKICFIKFTIITEMEKIKYCPTDYLSNLGAINSFYIRHFRFVLDIIIHK